MKHSPQSLAALWHWSHLLLAGAAFCMAILGVYGHYRLRKPYQRWHESKRQEA